VTSLDDELSPSFADDVDDVMLYDVVVRTSVIVAVSFPTGPRQLLTTVSKLTNVGSRL
jgi:hypothetical protein